MRTYRKTILPNPSHIACFTVLTSARSLGKTALKRDSFSTICALISAQRSGSHARMPRLRPPFFHVSTNRLHPSIASSARRYARLQLPKRQAGGHLPAFLAADSAGLGCGDGVGSMDRSGRRAAMPALVVVVVAPAHLGSGLRNFCRPSSQC